MTWWRWWCPGWQLPMAANGMETLEQRIVWYAWRTRQYIESLYICYLYKYDASNPYAHMHNCHPFGPLTLAHTHTPLCVGLNENGACWPNERELFTYAVSMCGSWEGRAVSIYTTYADPIKAREGSKKQTTNNFWGRFGAHTHIHTQRRALTKNGCNACRGLLLAFCLLLPPCATRRVPGIHQHPCLTSSFVPFFSFFAWT